MLFKALFAATLAVAASATAFGQDASTSVTAEKNPSLRHNSLEVRPLESLASATPGLASGGLSFESYLGKNFAINFGGSYADVDLPTKYVTTVNDKTNKPMVNRGYGYAADAGIRYYDAPIGDSVYGGFDLSYGEAHNGWKFHDEAYDTQLFVVTPSLLVGYRWVWESGFLLRFGAGAGMPSIASKKVEATTLGPLAAEGAKKINDTLDQRVLAKVDLGLGVMF